MAEISHLPWEHRTVALLYPIHKGWGDTFEDYSINDIMVCLHKAAHVIGGVPVEACTTPLYPSLWVFWPTLEGESLLSWWLCMQACRARGVSHTVSCWQIGCQPWIEHTWSVWCSPAALVVLPPSTFQHHQPNHLNHHLQHPLSHLQLILIHLCHQFIQLNIITSISTVFFSIKLLQKRFG